MDAVLCFFFRYEGSGYSSCFGSLDSLRFFEVF